MLSLQHCVCENQPKRHDVQHNKILSWLCENIMLQKKITLVKDWVGIIQWMRAWVCTNVLIKVHDNNNNNNNNNNMTKDIDKYDI